MHDNFDICIKKCLYRFNCPSSDELGDYHLEILPDTIQKRIKQHLEHCAHCRDELQVLQQFEQADDNTLPSGSVLLPVKELLTRIGRQIETIIYHPQTRLSALRGGGRKRHNHYKLKPEVSGDEMLDLYLGFEEIESGYSIQVQCLPVESQSGILLNALVEIWLEGQLVDTIVIDKYFTFQFRLKDLSPLIIRITNKRRLIYKFQVQFEG